MKNELRYAQNPATVQGEAESRTIEGTAFVYNEWSKTLYDEKRKVYFKEKYLPGCAAHLLTGDVIASRSHMDDKILARTASGTLTLTDTPTALQYRFDAQNTTAGNDTLVDVRCGNISGSSFEFNADPAHDNWNIIPNGISERTIGKFSGLYAVNPVVFPASLFTEVQARAAEFIAEARKPAPDTEDPAITRQRQLLSNKK